VLVSRFIDRSIRPLFPRSSATRQITATVLGGRQEPSDIPAFVGASACLTLSQLPFLGPISAALARNEGR
jgi:polyribonucleotide nucleotidyltransferase